MRRRSPASLGGVQDSACVADHLPRWGRAGGSVSRGSVRVTCRTGGGAGRTTRSVSVSTRPRPSVRTANGTT